MGGFPYCSRVERYRETMVRKSTPHYYCMRFIVLWYYIILTIFNHYLMLVS